MGWWRGGVEVGIDGLRFDLRGCGLGGVWRGVDLE